MYLFIVRSGNPILRSPEGRSDYGQGNDNTHNVTTCFSARKRYRTHPAPLFCILFSGKTEKSMPAERQLRSRNDNGTVVNTKNVPRLWRGRADRAVRPYRMSEAPRLPYVKYSTGANMATRIIFRARRKPDSTTARRAFLELKCNDNT